MVSEPTHEEGALHSIYSDCVHCTWLNMKNFIKIVSPPPGFRCRNSAVGVLECDFVEGRGRKPGPPDHHHEHVVFIRAPGAEIGDRTAERQRSRALSDQTKNVRRNRNPRKGKTLSCCITRSHGSCGFITPAPVVWPGAWNLLAVDI